MIRSSLVAVLVVAAATVGCGSSRGESEPPAADEVAELASEFRLDLYECVVALGVPASLVGRGMVTPDNGGWEVNECNEALLDEPRYEIFDYAP